MTTQVPPSALLPLNPEQLARLQAATTDLTPTQLAWVSGYFWGVLNQQPAALAATPAPAAEMPGITIISASQTGNARRVAEALRDDLLAAKLNVKLVNAGDYKFKQIASEKLLIVVTSTQGEGEPPEEAVALHKFLFSKKAPKLENTAFAVFSLGDSSYEFFCQSGKDFDSKLAELGANLCKEYRAKTEGHFRFEYSPESFTGTEPEFALEICNAVLKIWEPTPEDPVIINLPVTVSHSMPHVYANQVEYMSDNLYRRENVIISLHPHNDRGCAVADSELGLLAGGDRIEGTLFGNGERTGNVDIVTLALNMYSQGVDPELDFSNMPEIVEVYERVTRMHVYERSPYSGQLVFAAFSGSHQDAIAKGMHWREEHDCKHWNVPYLPINPEDVGRVYEADVIRINSQSGKGGVSYLMETKYGYHIPQKMRESFGYLVKGVSDHAHKELLPEEVLDIFTKHYVNVETPVSIPEVHFVQKGENAIGTEATISYKGSTETVHGDGNGRLDAVSNAVKAHLNMDFSLTTYTEHALEVCSNSKAVAYVGLEKNGKTYWGVGVHSDIINSSISAFLSALNAMLMDLKK